MHVISMPLMMSIVVCFCSPETHRKHTYHTNHNVPIVFFLNSIPQAWSACMCIYAPPPLLTGIVPNGALNGAQAQQRWKQPWLTMFSELCFYQSKDIS